jgi:HPt (histidine-containing phosphotransfer) domain-containing protein
MNETREEKVTAARARIAELAAKFVERSRQDLRTMRDELAKVRAGDPAGLAPIRQLAHRMCGTGATLGFDALADAAARAETLIDKLPAGRPPDAAILENLAGEISALESELANLALRRS